MRSPKNKFTFLLVLFVTGSGGAVLAQGCAGINGDTCDDRHLESCGNGADALAPSAEASTSDVAAIPDAAPDDACCPSNGTGPRTAGPRRSSMGVSFAATLRTAEVAASISTLRRRTAGSAATCARLLRTGRPCAPPASAAFSARRRTNSAAERVWIRRRPAHAGGAMPARSPTAAMPRARTARAAKRATRLSRTAAAPA